MRFFLLPWVFPFLPCFFSFLLWSSSFCRESFLLPWVFFFCREVISFAITVVGHRNRIAQMIFKWKCCLFFFFTRVKRVVQTFLSWTRGEDKCAWSLFPFTQRYGGTNHTLFFFSIAQFLLFKRCRKQSIPQAGVYCQWNINKANRISQIGPSIRGPLVINIKIVPV